MLLKKLYTVLLLILISCKSYSQPFVNNRNGAERIHAAKMAYITDRIHLTDEQIVGFVPVYNKFEMERRNIVNDFKQKYGGNKMDDADENLSKQFIEDRLDFQQKLIEIRKKYKEQFLKYISYQQLVELTKAEKEFTQILKNHREKRNMREYNGRNYWER